MAKDEFVFELWVLAISRVRPLKTSVVCFTERHAVVVGPATPPSTAAESPGHTSYTQPGIRLRSCVTCSCADRVLCGCCPLEVCTDLDPFQMASCMYIYAFFLWGSPIYPYIFIVFDRHFYFFFFSLEVHSVLAHVLFVWNMYVSVCAVWLCNYAWDV